jgi:hypothetical protein
LRETIERRQAPGKFLVRRAVERGELPPDTDIDLAHELIMAPLVQRSMLNVELDIDDFRRMLTIIVIGINASECRVTRNIND